MQLNLRFHHSAVWPWSLAWLLCVHLGCTTSEVRKPESAPSPAPETQQPAAEEAKSSPLLVQVQGPLQPVTGTPSTIGITVTRRMVMPVDLTVTLPRGVRLLSGNLQERVEDQGRAPITRQLTVQFDAIPAEDIVVEAVTRGTGFGAKSADAYRFGRPAPKLPQPARGPEIRLPGKSMGEPVDLNR